MKKKDLRGGGANGLKDGSPYVNSYSAIDNPSKIPVERNMKFQTGDH